MFSCHYDVWKYPGLYVVGKIQSPPVNLYPQYHITIDLILFLMKEAQKLGMGPIFLMAGFCVCEQGFCHLFIDKRFSYVCLSVYRSASSIISHVFFALSLAASNAFGSPRLCIMIKDLCCFKTTPIRPLYMD